MFTGSQTSCIPGGNHRRRNALSALFAALVIVDGSAEAADYLGRARVINGDTVSIRNQRIRIAAIDACERDQTGLKTGRFGAVASPLAAILEKCSTPARSLRHHRSGSVSPPGGPMLHWRPTLALRWVKAGLAEAMLRFLPPTHSMSEVEYGHAENRARDNSFGMWSAEIESPHVYRRSKPSGNQ